MPAAQPLNCRHCGKPLDLHTRLTGGVHCRSAACLHQSFQLRLAQLKATLTQSAPAAARSQLPERAGTPAGVVWLEPCDTDLQPVSEDDRAGLQAYLHKVVAEDLVIDRDRLASPTADGDSPTSARLCGHCGGRCCQHGAAWNAFIDVTLLRQWQLNHPGGSLEAAAQAYLAMLPEAHVRGACLYQTAAGCAMPRQQRAWICNGYACEPLQQLQALSAHDAQASVVALTLHRGAIERAAVVGADFTQAVQIDPSATAVRH